MGFRCKIPIPAPCPPGAALLLLLLLLLLRPGGPHLSQPALTTAVPTLTQPVPTLTPPVPTLTPPVPTLTQPVPTLTLPSESPASPGTDILPTCGTSHEQDPTLRDPDSMARRWPWVVSVRANGTHICTGTLIASQWVLAVAHCLTQHSVTYSVQAGSPWADGSAPTATTVPAHQVIVNSRFRSRRLWSWVGQANNIALLQLKRPLKYSKYVWPVCLPGFDHEVKDASLCTVTGWGLPGASGKWPQTLQEKEVTILNSRECDSFYHKFSKIPSIIRIINSQMLCAEDKSREQFCYETTGEPLVCPVDSTWFLVGVASWGPGCGKSGAPPIYLRISAYKHWIWQQVNAQGPRARPLLLALALPLSLLAAA